MATARKTTKEIMTYTLELSEEEYDWLVLLVGGARVSDMSSNVYNALVDVHTSETPSPAPLAVGDRVRMTEGTGAFNGRIGTLSKVDPADEFLPYLVLFDDGDYWWTKGVERA